VFATGWLFSGQGDDFVCRTLGPLFRMALTLRIKNDLIGSPTPVQILFRVIFIYGKSRHTRAKIKVFYSLLAARKKIKLEFRSSRGDRPANFWSVSIQSASRSSKRLGGFVFLRLRKVNAMQRQSLLAERYFKSLWYKAAARGDQN